MDDNRFDLLAKSLSSGLSRRSLLRSLVAAVGIAAVGVEQANAAPGGGKGGNGNKKCYGDGSQCTNAKQCCSGTCTNRVCTPEVDLCATLNCEDDNPCTTDSCAAGQCVHTPIDKGTPCGPGGWMQCDATGQCAPPLMCNPGATEECYSGDYTTYNVGMCRAGAHVCDPTGMQWGPCIGEVLPKAEICGNGQDDDCDGVIDNGCGGEQCMVATDCPYMDTACQTRTCVNGICGFDYVAAGTLLPEELQTPSDCRLAVCDGYGNVSWEADDADTPPAKPCVNYVCSNGGYTYTIDVPGTACVSFDGFDGICDANGGCVPS